ncbi:anti-sigma factor family protein [Carboxylicivirga linearis]|uniref:Zf-HC2 domain-containing protein n=1 Tax=Carboxylicivirga linearis TaxID=1628157 RepID=A0ABS5JRI8_9BACT|nr:zf-HC2 domain-containing protein [Carboxylicivirga linearis]MBS2097457.1 zf-HC2 domain-containing protein [Carboxylicivirga linearis]
MNCLDEGIIQSYIDGELSDKEMSDVAMHISSCKHCLAQLKQQEERKNTLLDIMQNANDKVEVPAFNVPVQVVEIPLRRSRVWMKVSAACVFLILLLTTYQSQDKEQKEIFFYPEWQDQVDANLPITQQSFTITYTESSVN